MLMNYQYFNRNFSPIYQFSSQHHINDNCRINVHIATQKLYSKGYKLFVLHSVNIVVVLVNVSNTPSEFN